MKILVYGAGVLGSYLVWALNEAGHEVTVLARGKRYEALKEQGLVIEHHSQKRTTVSRVSLTDTFDENDEYDAVFVVMQKTQIQAALPNLAANKKCGLFILTGNNGEAEKTYSDFMNMSRTKPTLLFGFLGVGGRHEEGRIISVHTGEPHFVVGDITEKADYKEIFKTIFSNSCIKPLYSENINSWLKYHLAVIVPLVFAIHYAKGDMRKLSKSGRIIKLTIQAVKEGLSMLAAKGFPPEPESLVKRFDKPIWLWQLQLKPMVRTKAFKLAAVDHAMAAIAEMKLLSEEFGAIKEKSGVMMPSYDELSAYIM